MSGHRIVSSCLEQIYGTDRRTGTCDSDSTVAQHWSGFEHHPDSAIPIPCWDLACVTSPSPTWFVQAAFASVTIESEQTRPTDSADRHWQLLIARLLARCARAGFRGS